MQSLTASPVTPSDCHDFMGSLVTQEWDRIASEPTDRLVHQMFTVGLTLQRVSHRVDDPEIRDLVARAVSDLDDAIGKFAGSCSPVQAAKKAPAPMTSTLPMLRRVLLRHSGVGRWIQFRRRDGQETRSCS